MGIETERKFLIKHKDCLEYADDNKRISQGYLTLAVDRTVRVRVAGDVAWLTVKGRNRGSVRAEFEYQIPFQDGLELLEMCEGGVIEKTRHIIFNSGFTVEVDVFEGLNSGLVVAEIEFEEDDPQAVMLEEKLRPRLPQWIGKEVTNDERYYNSSLSINPYCTWSS